MPWGSGHFTQKVGPSPVFTGTTVWEQDAAAGILIEAERHDYHDQDIADGIDACLNKNGANTAAANINWGGFKITDLGNGTTATDAAAYGQVPISASLDSGTNVLTLTKADGTTFTVDLSALAVGGSTTDFARLSNTQTFTGTANTFNSVHVTAGNGYRFDAGSGSILQWDLYRDNVGFYILRNGGEFLRIPNAGTDFYAASSKVWTEANLPSSTFTGLLTSTGGPYTVTGTWAVSGQWTFTNTNLKLPGFLWSAGTGGTTWTAGPIDASTLAFTEPGGTKNLLYVIDSSTVAGAYIQIGASAKRVWDRGNLPTLLTAAPINAVGQDGDGAFVISGADKGVWVKVSGAWAKIAS